MKNYKVKLTENEINLLKKYGYDDMASCNNKFVTKKSYMMIYNVVDSIMRKEGLVGQSVSL